MGNKKQFIFFQAFLLIAAAFAMVVICLNTKDVSSTKKEETFITLEETENGNADMPEETENGNADISEEPKEQKEPEYPVVTSSSFTKRVEAFFAAENIYCIFNGKEYLYLNQEGYSLTGETYTWAYAFQEGLACCCKGEKYGFIDREGNTAIPFEFQDAAPFSEGLAYFCKDDRYGFMDHRGKIRFYLDCDSVSSFEEGLAYISVDGKYGYIDQEGKTVIEPKYEDAGYFQDGFAEVMQNGKRGIIDKTGRQVVAPEYTEIKRQESYFLARKDEKYYIFDSMGNSMLEEPCDWAGQTFLEECVEFDYKEEGNSGFIYQGNLYLFPEIYNFKLLIPKHHLVIAEKDSFYGVIDFEGNVKLPFCQENICYQEGADTFLVSGINQCSIINAGDFSKRMEGAYDSIMSFTKEQAVVEKNGMYGIIDMDGNVVMPVSCEKIQSFENGAYWYRMDDDSYLYDENGNLINTGIYQYIWYEGGCYKVESDDYTQGFLNARGERIIFTDSYDYRYLGRYQLLKGPGYVIVDTGEGEDEQKVYCNRITSRAKTYQNFLKNAPLLWDELSENSSDSGYSEWNGSEIVSRLYDFSHTGSPLLYVFATSYEWHMNRRSYSGFFALKGEEAICQISGYEGGGSGLGNYVMAWYDREEGKLLYGSNGAMGGGVYGSYGTVCEEMDGELYPRVDFQWAEYPGEDGESKEEYLVNGEPVSEESYNKVRERYQWMELPQSNDP